MSLDNVYNSVSISKNIQVVMLGFLVWIVPFIVSMLLFSPKGMIVGVATFNSIMSVTLAFITGIALVLYLKDITQDYFKIALTAGIVWLVMSVLFDLLILLPLSGMALSSYITDVAIGYLVIPLIALTVGKLLDVKASHSKRIVTQFAKSK